MKNNYDTFKSLQGRDLSEDELHGKITLANDFNEFFRHSKSWNLAYLGQLLTDFKNGIGFKNFLERINCAGYIFEETPGNPTYCILYSHHLSNPQKTLTPKGNS